MSAAPAIQTPSAPKPSIVAIVQRQIDALISKDALVFPEDFSVANALAAAKLTLQTVQNLEKKPVVDANGRPTGVVTEASMVNAIFDMCVQGLNVGKKQGYFIVYGNQLTFQRSYFGEMALAMRVRPDIDFYADVVRADDEFETEKIRTNKRGFIEVITKHKVARPRKSPITDAYVGMFDINTGEDIALQIMDIDRIHKSWAKSKTYKPDAKYGPHVEFEDEMAMRTVIRRICKPVINSSSDKILLESVRRQDEDQILASMDEEEAANANGQIIEFPAGTQSLPAAAAQEAEFKEEVQEPAKPAEGEHDVAALAATLKINEDTLTFLKGQLKDFEEEARPVPTIGEFLQSMVTGGVKTLKGIKEAMAAIGGSTSESSGGDEGPGY